MKSCVDTGEARAKNSKCLKIGIKFVAIFFSNAFVFLHYIETLKKL